MKLALPTPSVGQSEALVLSCMFTNPEVIPELATSLSPAEFFDESNRAMYEAILHCHRLSADFSVQMIVDRLTAVGQLGRIGGTGFIQSLLSLFCSTATLPYHIARVKDTAFRRGVIDLCLRAAEDAAEVNTTEARSMSADLCSQLARIASQNGPGSTTTIRTALGEFVNRIEQGEPNSISTGIEDFDNLIGGLPKQGVVVVLGVNGSGKSSLVGNWVCQLAYRHGLSGRVHSFEMGDAASICMAASETGVRAMDHLRRGTMPSGDEFRRLISFMDLEGSERVMFSDRALTAQEIYTQACADAVRGHKFVVIDYIQNLVRRDGQDATAAILEAAQVAQRISREHKMLVIVVSQMTLDAKRKAEPPKANDGIGGSSIGDVSDLTVGVFRPSLWESPESFNGGDWETRKREASLHVTKNKFGPLGVVNVDFIGAEFKFRDIAGSATFTHGGN